ncbi:DgyrCDS440 [Dimorphilus gyrociliatus]|uniref:Cytochrome c oxidase assembly protein COX20, mitochondrial n=1 Tax=Dimorphilus gyrociliatus TaxID=2664684 RepID=A0A7I8V646_9ANNE|nr:DgyrCDS440 [Dimorphilus gyrociliatus]
MSQEEESSGFIFLGKDISKIPCFKQAFTSGILGGITTGFGYFFYSSNVKKSCNIGVGSYALVTLGFYSYCRYKFTKKLQDEALMKKALQAKILSEGTNLEAEIKEKTKA